MKDPIHEQAAGEAVQHSVGEMLHEETLGAVRLRDLPTLAQGHWGNLKVDEAMPTRIWVNRETNEIEVEIYIDGTWQDLDVR